MATTKYMATINPGAVGIWCPNVTQFSIKIYNTCKGTSNYNLFIGKVAVGKKKYSWGSSGVSFTRKYFKSTILNMF